MKEKKQKRVFNPDSLYIGDEPTYDDPKKDIGVCRSLSWYSNQFGPKESKKYTLEYAKNNKYSKDILSKLSSANDELFKNLGFVCRMVSRGANFGIEKFNWIDDKINEIVDYKADSFVSSVSNTQEPPKAEKTIQEKVFEYATVYINEIEGHVDSFIKKRESNFKCYDWFSGMFQSSLFCFYFGINFVPKMLKTFHYTPVKYGRPELVSSAVSSERATRVSACTLFALPPITTENTKLALFAPAGAAMVGLLS